MSAFKIPEMTAEEFSRWRSLLEERAGLWLTESRKAFLVTRLNQHIREKKLSRYEDYFTILEQSADSSLNWANVIDALTVHETSFYRDKESLNLVTDYCKTKALEKFNQDPEAKQNIQIWSVGCSTGEEAYSLAFEMEKLNIVLKEITGNMIYYGVLGIDVSYPSLAVAREGIYAGKKAASMPATSLNGYFEQLADGQIQVKGSVRKRTCFMQNNILDLNIPASENYDVVYCQNVMIYFRKERKQAIVDELIRRLKPGGILVLGHGEVTDITSSNLTRVNNKHCLAFIKSENNITCMAELS